MILALSALTLLPLTVVSIYCYLVASKALEEKVREYSHDSLFQITMTLGDRLKDVEELTFNVLNDTSVQNTLAAVHSDEPSALELVHQHKLVQEALASQVLFHDELTGVFLESDRGQSFVLDKTLDGVDLTDDQTRLIQEGAGSPVWIDDDSQHSRLLVGRQVNSTKTQLPIGRLVASVPESFVSEVISDKQYALGGDISVVDESGQVVSAADKSLLGTTVDILGGGEFGTAYSFERRVVNGDQVYVALSEPLANGWRVLSIVPVGIYMNEVDSLRSALLVGWGAILVGTVMAATALADGFSKPIRSLSRDMERFGGGDLEKRSVIKRNDEIGQLSTSFNAMADNINDLIRRVYEEQTTKREIEVRALRMQINPHFLYNTLDTISWIARAEGANEAAAMTKAFGVLLRATTDSPDQVPLVDEIAKLEAYVGIQRYRYGTRIDFAIDTEASVESALVPSLIIQPLVENAIAHGFDSTGAEGHVRVSAASISDSLIIRVEDDGAGMPPETVEWINSLSSADAEWSDSSSGSIGLTNVVRRIQAVFGRSASIVARSELGDGAQVSIVLPFSGVVVNNNEE